MFDIQSEPRALLRTGIAVGVKRAVQHQNFDVVPKRSVLLLGAVAAMIAFATLASTWTGMPGQITISAASPSVDQVAATNKSS